jgi:hypothetical protein
VAATLRSYNSRTPAGGSLERGNHKATRGTKQQRQHKQGNDNKEAQKQGNDSMKRGSNKAALNNKQQN